MANEKTRPVFDRRIQNIRVAVWQNESSNGRHWYTVATERTYKKKDSDEFATASNFNGIADTVVLIELLTQAKDWLVSRLEEDKAEEA